MSYFHHMGLIPQSLFSYSTRPQGCPANKGCALVLRGEAREALQDVEKIIQFGILVAYHLRLETAYYNDRYEECEGRDRWSVCGMCVNVLLLFRLLTLVLCPQSYPQSYPHLLFTLSLGFVATIQIN